MEGEIKMKWYSFVGDDFCDDCNGWDGSSRRCDCGNRRVCWECLLDECDKEIEDCANCQYGYAEAW
jgi:hypothetical protein